MPNQAQSLSLRRGGGDCQQTTLPGIDTPQLQNTRKETPFPVRYNKSSPPAALGGEGHAKGTICGRQDRSLSFAQCSVPQPVAQVRNQVFAEIKSKHNCKWNCREKL